jgi:hypothetical protein
MSSLLVKLLRNQELEVRVFVHPGITSTPISQAMHRRIIAYVFMSFCSSGIDRHQHSLVAPDKHCSFATTGSSSVVCTYVCVPPCQAASMKRAVDDFNVMVTRKEASPASPSPREYYDNVTSFTFPSTTVYVGQRGGEGVCCRPDPDPDFVAPTRLMYGMTDEQLFWCATMVPAAAE